MSGTLFGRFTMIAAWFGIRVEERCRSLDTRIDIIEKELATKNILFPIPSYKTDFNQQPLLAGKWHIYFLGLSKSQMEWRETGQSGTDLAVYQLISETLRNFAIKTLENTANGISRRWSWHCKESYSFKASSFSTLLSILFLFFCNRETYSCFPQT